MIRFEREPSSCCRPKKAFVECRFQRGIWHAVHVIEPSVIFEAKDGVCKG